jgi:hypothetical protein
MPKELKLWSKNNNLRWIHVRYNTFSTLKGLSNKELTVPDE